MPRSLIVATALIAALMPIGLRSAAPQAPLPVISRSDKAPASPFDRPPLIVLGKVFEQRTVVVDERRTDSVGDPDVPPKLERLYLLSNLLVLRVNERLPSDPDLGGRSNLLLREKPGSELKLKFGRYYILSIKFAKALAGLPWPEVNGTEPPPYEIALPEGGFEIIGFNHTPTATVRLIRAGRALAPFDGKPFDEVFRQITGQTFLEWEPKFRR